MKRYLGVHSPTGHVPTRGERIVDDLLFVAQLIGHLLLRATLVAAPVIGIIVLKDVLS